MSVTGSGEGETIQNDQSNEGTHGERLARNSPACCQPDVGFNGADETPLLAKLLPARQPGARHDGLR